MSQVLDILTLQEIDDESAGLRSALASVEQRLQSNQALNDARRFLEHAESEVAQVERRQRKLNGDIDGLTARIEPEERRLYDGSVKVPKELSSIQHEVEILRRQRSALEDQALEAMSHLEALQEKRGRAGSRVADLERQWAAERLQLELQAAELREKLASIDERRAGQQARVPTRALTLYEDLRRRKGGMAVARIRGGACSGCRVTLPAGLRHKAMAPDTLVQCPNCERILSVG
jgi:hypothetical protein